MGKRRNITRENIIIENLRLRNVLRDVDGCFVLFARKLRRGVDANRLAHFLQHKAYRCATGKVNAILDRRDLPHTMNR